MREIGPLLNGAELRIAVVRGRFNEVIGAGLLAACLERLTALGVQSGRVTVATVPGALEIPLALSFQLEDNAVILVGPSRPIRMWWIRRLTLELLLLTTRITIIVIIILVTG